MNALQRWARERQLRRYRQDPATRHDADVKLACGCEYYAWRFVRWAGCETHTL